MSISKKYKNDIDLYLDKKEYYDYVYDKETVNKYISKQRSLNRICFAIMCGEQLVGEIKLYDESILESVTLGISMKNDYYKNKGHGSRYCRYLWITNRGMCVYGGNAAF